MVRSVGGVLCTYVSGNELSSDHSACRRGLAQEIEGCRRVDSECFFDASLQVRKLCFGCKGHFFWRLESMEDFCCDLFEDWGIF